MPRTARTLTTLLHVLAGLAAGLAVPWRAAAQQPTCNGKPATTVGAGRIEGSAFGDVIVGSAGKDIIRGLGGDDAVCALGGDDVTTGDGADTVDGGTGNDNLRGGGGKDALFGSDGDDAVAGQDEDDTLSGGAGVDKMTLGAGERHGPGRRGQRHALRGCGHGRAGGGWKFPGADHALRVGHALRRHGVTGTRATGAPTRTA